MSFLVEMELALVHRQFKTVALGDLHEGFAFFKVALVIVKPVGKRVLQLKGLYGGAELLLPKRES